MLQLDHIMYAVPDLDSGSKDLATRLGAQPVYGGPHPGRGTHNALLSLGDSRYLEIIAPDPEQTGIEGDLAGLEAPRIKTWAVATDDFTNIQQVCDSLGLKHSKLAMSRNTPAGPTLNWELMFIAGHGFGDLLPFFIDWFESPHPAATTVQGGTLQSFTIETPEAARYRDLMAAFGIDGVRVEERAACLRAEILGRDGHLTEL